MLTLQRRLNVVKCAKLVRAMRKMQLYTAIIGLLDISLNPFFLVLPKLILHDKSERERKRV